MPDFHLANYYGPSDLLRRLRSFRLPSPNHGLYDLRCPLTMVLSTSFADYGPFDLRRQTTNTAGEGTSFPTGGQFCSNLEGHSCQCPDINNSYIDFMGIRYGLGGNLDLSHGQYDSSNASNIEDYIFQRVISFIHVPYWISTPWARSQSRPQKGSNGLKTDHSSPLIRDTCGIRPIPIKDNRSQGDSIRPLPHRSTPSSRALTYNLGKVIYPWWILSTSSTQVNVIEQGSDIQPRKGPTSLMDSLNLFRTDLILYMKSAFGGEEIEESSKISRAPTPPPVNSHGLPPTIAGPPPSHQPTSELSQITT
ncbi:hypothetical protein M5K25_012192 [Dendrobium thyrsiflorum]|uniref:Uncharacterized protein n=1 Tax=Dendrobium thyrsiflorum TaxID=117978 RepID=A0ABD0UWU2_DENTH